MTGVQVSWPHGGGTGSEVGVAVGFVTGPGTMGTRAIVVTGNGLLIEKDISVLRLVKGAD